MNADKAILTAGIVTAGSVIGSTVIHPTDDHGQPLRGHSASLTPRLLIGTGLAFTGLSILGQFAPGIAVPLSITVAVTALMWYGIPVLETAMKEK